MQCGFAVGAGAVAVVDRCMECMELDCGAERRGLALSANVQRQPWRQSGHAMMEVR